MKQTHSETSSMCIYTSNSKNEREEETEAKQFNSWPWSIVLCKPHVMSVSVSLICDKSTCNLTEQMKAHKLLCLRFTTVPTKFSKEITKNRLTPTGIAERWGQTWIMTDTEYQTETRYESQVNCAELWGQKIFCF